MEEKTSNDSSDPGSSGVRFVEDPKVSFTAFKLTASPSMKAKEGRKMIRQFIAHMSITYMRFLHNTGHRGAIVYDIDDTLVTSVPRSDEDSGYIDGFEYLNEMFHSVRDLFTVYIVTARPDSDKVHVMNMLKRNNIIIDPDRLRMVPEDDYHNGPSDVTQKVKWEEHLKIDRECRTRNETILAKFGDRLWDVANIDSLSTYLKHIPHNSAYVFWDTHPEMRGCMSCKLVGSPRG